HRIDGLALAREVELLAAAVRRLLAAVRPRDERRTALTAQPDRGQEVLRLVALPHRPPHVVLQLRHRRPPGLLADDGWELVPLYGVQLARGVVLDVASVKRVRQQVPHGIDGELRPARGEVTSAVQVLTDAPDRERRLTEERIERPPDGLGLLGDQLAISRPAERLPGRRGDAFCASALVRSDLALGLAPSLEPGEGGEHCRSELPVRRREVDLAVNGDDAEAEVDQGVEVLRAAQETVHVHRDDHRESARSGVIQHLGPTGASAALLRRRHRVVLVDLDHGPVLGLGQRPDPPQLGLDGPPVALTVHRGADVCGDLVRLPQRYQLNHATELTQRVSQLRYALPHVDDSGPDLDARGTCRYRWEQSNRRCRLFGEVMDAEVRAVDADLVGADADLHCLLQRFSRAVGAAGGVMTETQESECLHAHTNLVESSIIPAGFRVPGPRPGSTLAGPTHILTDSPQTHRFVVPRRQRRPRP